MAKREMDLSPVCVKTKAKIKYEATKLFALKGFDAVSIRNIGRAVGIKASSIYSHYASKEALLEDIFENFETLYLEYFAWLTEENKKSDLAGRGHGQYV